MANSGCLEVSVLSNCLSQDSLIKTSTWPRPREQDLQGHHHSKSVNNLRIAGLLSKRMKYQTISILLYFIYLSYNVACTSFIKYVGRSDV